MSQQLTEPHTRQQQGDKIEHPNHTSKGADKIGWFAKNFPQFFTAEIIANRKAPLVMQPSKPNWVMLRRKVGKKQTSFIRLEKLSDGTLMFSCGVTNNKWRIQPALLISMAVMPKTNHVSDWAGIRILGKEDLVVNRVNLLTALRFFKVLS